MARDMRLDQTLPSHILRPWVFEMADSKALVAFMRKASLPFRLVAKMRKLQQETGIKITIVDSKPQGITYPSAGFVEEESFRHIKAILPNGVRVFIAGHDLEFAHKLLSCAAFRQLPEAVLSQRTERVARVYVNVHADQDRVPVKYLYANPIDVYLRVRQGSEEEIAALQAELLSQLEQKNAWPCPDYLIVRVSPALV